MFGGNIGGGFDPVKDMDSDNGSAEGEFGKA